MTPAQHSIQHSNLDKLLNRLDTISSGFFGGIISKITSFLITVLLLGLAAYGVKMDCNNRRTRMSTPRGIRNNNHGNRIRGRRGKG